MRKVLTVFLSIFFISFYSYGGDLNSCFVQAAARYNIPPALLIAIAKVESGFRPWVININHNGQSVRVINPKSYEEAIYYLSYLHQNGYNYDVGIGQINVWNVKRLRIDPVSLLDPCNNLMVSAYILRENIDKYGFTWDAIWRYNGRKDYAYKVYRALISMGLVAQRR
ncbi:MAG: lytic transglycosylase domain-containing protein [Hydrogenothermaceae bacterium]